MPHSLTRRELMRSTLLAVPALSLVSQPAPVFARQPDLATLDLPTLDIIVTPETFEGVPESVAAGRYLLNVSGPPDVEWFSSAGLFMPPTGMSLEETLALIGNLDPDAELPDIAYEATFAGGVIASPGSTTSVVIDLTPGTWLVWGNDLESPQIPVPLTVTGTFPAAVPEPDATATFLLTDFAIAIEGTLTSGAQIVAVTAEGEPHFVRLFQAPEGTTNDDAAALIGSCDCGTPAATSLTWGQLIEFTFIPVQSNGVTTWRNLALLPGTYLAICGFFTAGSTIPHYAHGMHTVFVVS